MHHDRPRLRPNLPLLTATGLALVALSCGEADAQPSYKSPDEGPAREPMSWDAPPAMSIDASKDYSAKIVTNKGEIVVDLFEDKAPMTVNNFVFLAREDYFDGVGFHRIIDQFMSQGGDPTGTGRGGPGYQFDSEIDPTLSHTPYTLSMANAGPNTNGSQFFIMAGDVDPQVTASLDGGYSIFGRVTEGKDVADAINTTPTGIGDKPLDRIVMNDVVIMVDGEPMDAPATQPAE